MKLIVDNLDIAYKDKILIKNFNLELRAGTVIGLNGANGAGKSTLLKIIMRLLPISCGRITINDRDIVNYKITDFAKLVNCLYQANKSVETFTVKDLVSTARYSYKDKIQNNEIIDLHCNLFNLTDIQGIQLNYLSGGQLQMAYLAKTFAQCSKFCILDEPSTNLDSKNKSLIEQVIKSKKQSGFAYLIIDHDLTFLKNVCDDIVNVSK